MTHHTLTLYSWGMKCLVLSGSKNEFKACYSLSPAPLAGLAWDKATGGMQARIYQVAKEKG